MCENAQKKVCSTFLLPSALSSCEEDEEVGEKAKVCSPRNYSNDIGRLRLFVSGFANLPPPNPTHPLTHSRGRREHKAEAKKTHFECHNLLVSSLCQLGSSIASCRII